MQYSVVVLGATGNIGGRIVQLLIKNPLCKKQVVITRRKTDIFAAPKAFNVVVNMARIEEEVAPYAQGVHVALAAFGVGKGSANMPEEDVRKIEIGSVATALNSGALRQDLTNPLGQETEVSSCSPPASKSRKTASRMQVEDGYCFTSIDPKTGRPTVDESKRPGARQGAEFCPSIGGGKDWPPEASSPQTKLLYIPANDNMHTARESGHRSDEATDLGIEHPTLDQEAIASLAYFYWEERGCPNDSPDEDWFWAEAELRNRFAAAASHS